MDILLNFVFYSALFPTYVLNSQNTREDRLYRAGGEKYQESIVSVVEPELA